MKEASMKMAHGFIKMEKCELIVTQQKFSCVGKSRMKTLKLPDEIGKSIPGVVHFAYLSMKDKSV